MKYNGLGITKNLYYGDKLPFLRQLLRTNIKLAFGVPKKAILYSERLQSGEKFMLYNESHYPYNYSSETYNEARSPTNIALYLNNIIGELKFFKVNNMNMSEKSLENIETNLLDSIKNLDDILSSNREEQLDLPVVVYASYLYAATFLAITTKIADLHEDNFYKALRLFEKKIRFSDADSLLQVMFVLDSNNVCENELWGKIFSRFSEVRFDFEHTKVVNCSPHLFYYKDLPQESRRIPFIRRFFNFFLRGKPSISVFSGNDVASNTYKILENAVSKNIPGSLEALNDFIERVGELKVKQIKDKEELFNRINKLLKSYEMIEKDKNFFKEFNLELNKAMIKGENEFLVFLSKKEKEFEENKLIK